MTPVPFFCQEPTSPTDSWKGGGHETGRCRGSRSLAPIPAAEKALARAGRTMRDMDVIELNGRGGRWGLQLVCGGGGIGIATVVEREDY